MPSTTPPTARYGPEVQGAGLHHHPSPGPTDQRFLYGHVWVTLAWVLKHPRWGRMALPLLARLYVRDRDRGSIPPSQPWTFRTKLELACDLLRWLRQRSLGGQKPLWICADGFYAKRQVIRCVQEEQMVLFSRLRRDAALWSLPGPYQGRGRPRIYGASRISLSQRSSHPGGWQQVQVEQYGRVAPKTIKTFLATWRPAGGVIRVVLVQEGHGVECFFCTDAEVSPEQILEVMAARFSIEETFRDVKQVWGAGQQQVRNIQASVGAFHCCLWSYVLVEWWGWSQPFGDLVDRSQSPWDDPTRRPSHADRRRAFQRACLREELLQLQQQHPLPQEIQEQFEQWMQRAVA